jgi:hypothetical protein
MQDELDAMGLPTQIVIHGINEVGHETGNPLITQNRDLPWLQDTVTEDVWTAWGITFRDVVILDENNVPIAVYNLTLNDLNDPLKYAELKALFEAAAGN